MSAKDKTDFFWSDWLGDPAVRRLTPAERGLWIDCLALMAAANPTGYLCDDHGKPLTHEELARVTNAASPVEVAELLDRILGKGAASRDRTGRVFNRRMVRDASLRAKRKRAGQKGGQTTIAKYRALQRNDHLLKQVPQQKIRGPPRPFQSQNKKTRCASVHEAARASIAHPPQEQNKSAGSLATARCGGALTRPPDSEQSATPAKPPSAVTRAEFEEMFAARRREATK